MSELERRDREGDQIRSERYIYRISRGVDGIEADTDNFVRDARFDWQPVKLTENCCHVGRKGWTDYKSSSTVDWTL